MRVQARACSAREKTHERSRKCLMIYVRRRDENMNRKVRGQTKRS
jgi:hypothetical protein